MWCEDLHCKSLFLFLFLLSVVDLTLKRSLSCRDQECCAHCCQQCFPSTWEKDTAVCSLPKAMSSQLFATNYLQHMVPRYVAAT